MAECHRCRQACDDAELKDLAGNKVCEDCYIDAIEITKTCDPWAVHSAKNTMASQGGPQLTPLQQQVYDLVREQNEISPAAAAAHLGVSETELRQEFATLRHLELLRGKKTPDGVVLTLFGRD